jgi:hypothetical protein
MWLKRVHQLFNSKSNKIANMGSFRRWNLRGLYGTCVPSLMWKRSLLGPALAWREKYPEHYTTIITAVQAPPKSHGTPLGSWDSRTELRTARARTCCLTIPSAQISMPQASSRGFLHWVLDTFRSRRALSPVVTAIYEQ